VLLHSQTLDNAVWSLSTATISANATTAPDGTTTAEKLIPSAAADPAAADASQLQQIIAVASNTYTFSIYAKAAGQNSVRIRENNSWGNFLNLNLTTGVANIIGGNFDQFNNVQVQTLANGWFRLSFTTEAGVTNFSKYSIRGGETGDGTSGVFLWGAMLEVSDFGATDYIATTTAAVSVGPVSGLPRLDYLGSTCPRLLLEPQRSNLVTYSEQFNNAAWTPTDASITANAAIAPDGTMSADKLVENSANQAHYVQSASGTYTAATYSMSVFAKASERNILQLLFNGSANVNAFANFDLTNGVVSLVASATASIEDYGNGWYRCTINAALSASTVPLAFCVIVNSLTATRAASYLGNGTSGLFVWGMQSELGAYATSYIPTLGASVTRVADAASKTGISSLIGQTEGTVFVDFTINGLQSPYASAISLNDGVPNNYVWLTIFSNGNLRAEVYAGGVVQASIIKSGAVTGGRYKMAFGYKTNDFVLYVNGALVGTDTSGTTFSGTTLSRIDNNLAGIAGNEVSQSTNQALLFKTRLTNAQLAELTA
jgi:hypothetical protein